MANLNAIDNSATTAIQANPMLVDAGTSRGAMRPLERVSPRQSFASAMDSAANESRPSPAVLVANQLSPQNATQNHFEQVLSDSMGISDVRALAQLSELMSSKGDSNIDIARNVVSSRSVLATLSGQVVQSPGDLDGGGVRRAVVPPMGQHVVSSKNKDKSSAASADAAANEASGVVTGSLSSRFESGDDGISAIGYDRHGGTSYGKYQLASKAGSMDQFIKFLRTESPALAKRLAAAGEANTGGRGGAMPTEWKKIAQENPALFEDLQERFIHDSHYKPALQAVSERTGLDSSKMSAALQEVLWSTAVQHGPNGAARIFSRALEQVDASVAKNPGTQEFEKSMIENVYAMRSTQFGSSTQQVQNAVQNRLDQEKGLALAMLGKAEA